MIGSRFLVKLLVLSALVALILSLVPSIQPLISPANAAAPVCLRGTIRWIAVIESREFGFVGYDSNTISLCFPAEGGAVTGEFKIVSRHDNQQQDRRLDIKDPKPCKVRTTYSGVFDGTFGADKITGTVRQTTEGPVEVIEGCASVEFSPPEIVETAMPLTLTFDGKKAVGAIIYNLSDIDKPSEMPIEVTVVSGEPSKKGAESTPGPEPSKTADDPQKDLYGALASVGLAALQEGVQSKELIDKMWVYTSYNSKKSAVPYAAGVIDEFKDATGYLPLLATYHDRRAAVALGQAALMAAMETDLNEPLFPTVRSQLPVIAKLSKKATVSDKDLRAVERYVALLATMDVAKMEIGRSGK